MTERLRAGLPWTRDKITGPTSLNWGEKACFGGGISQAEMSAAGLNKVG